MSASIRDQLAAKRADAQRSTPARRTAAASAAASRASQHASEEVEDRTVKTQVKKAARSGKLFLLRHSPSLQAVGKLDISALDLHRIPPEVYTTLLGIASANLTRPPSPPPADPAIRDLNDSMRSLGTSDRGKVFGKEKVDETWVECEELTVFKAGNNRIRELEMEIGAFGGVKTIDLSHNQLSSLPNSFADLLRLTHIDLSNNAFEGLPKQVLLLSALTNLDLSHNNISTVEVSGPVEASDEGRAYGAGFLSTSFSRAQTKTDAILPALRFLDLGHNKLTNTGLSGMKSLKALKSLILEANKLRDVFDAAALGLDKSGPIQLTALNLSGNPSLRETKGDLSGVEVNMEDCNHVAAPAIRDPAATPAAAPVRPTKPALPVPPPTVTYGYRYLPAATFDSEPLNVDFDLYLPDSPPAAKSGHPLVIWFHGGGLLQGNKENLPPHLRRLPTFTHGAKGEQIAVISPNYRLAPQVPIIDILSDVTMLLDYVRNKLNDRLKKEGREHTIDTSRICLSGGSAGGYLAMIAGLGVPPRASDEDLGGYRGEKGIKCIAPFYPITDLADPFWTTETNPVPWWGKSVPHEAAKPHLDLKGSPVFTAKSGGPRSILYPYMLQHGLFPSLLFMRQKAIGAGLDGFRPTPESLSITNRLELSNKAGVQQQPVYFVYGTIDDKVQPMERTLELLKGVKGDVEVERVEGGDHAFDEESGEECEAFREWLGRTLV